MRPWLWNPWGLGLWILVLMSSSIFIIVFSYILNIINHTLTLIWTIIPYSTQKLNSHASGWSLWRPYPEKSILRETELQNGQHFHFLLSSISFESLIEHFAKWPKSGGCKLYKYQVIFFYWKRSYSVRASCFRNWRKIEFVIKMTWDWLSPKIVQPRLIQLSVDLSIFGFKMALKDSIYSNR